MRIRTLLIHLSLAPGSPFSFSLFNENLADSFESRSRLTYVLCLSLSDQFKGLLSKTSTEAEVLVP